MINRNIVQSEEFIKDLEYMKSYRKIRLYFDIETFQYNEEKGKVKPTEYKNSIYSVAFSYFIGEELKIFIVPNFYYFFICFKEVYSGRKTKPNIELIAHNNNKYDNHYLRYELINYFGMECKNQYLMNVTTQANYYSEKIKDISETEKQNGIILEKRVKSKNNLELNFFLYGIQFFTTDNYIKTHSSIKSLGERLLKVGKITEHELKTDYEYTKYNLGKDLTEQERQLYSMKIFKNLSESELLYIENDVIILAYSVKYYSLIFTGFNYDSITFTKNILDSYNTNPLTQFQLLHSYGSGKSKIDLNYTDYSFNYQNLYDYLKSFYNGGLNFYNDKFVGKVITEKVFGMDINSSYPSVMYKNKIPTYLDSWNDFDSETIVEIKDLYNDNYYTLYRLTKKTFDDYIINKLESRVIKQMLIKYFGKHDFININTFTFRLIKDVGNLDIKEIPVLSTITWECEYFGSRDKLKEYYQIKTQGQNIYKMNMDDLFNIYQTNEKVEYIYTDEEIGISKLNLNGLYGIPALRPYFNIFRWQGTQLNNIRNGFLNSQRNILFSVFVTSVSVYNLLFPLSYLSGKEIDNNFLYCDTDSLYLKKKVVDKIPKDIFDPNNLGFWDVQNEQIDYFYTLNHKKYCYQENGKIIVKSGGVPQDTFDTNMDFKDFIKTQFSHGKVLKSTRSIYNSQGTISIYDGYIHLEQGFDYPLESYNPLRDYKIFIMKEEIKKQIQGDEDDALYIESNFGTFSISELFHVEHNPNEQNIKFYKLKENYLKELIISNC